MFYNYGNPNQGRYVNYGQPRMMQPTHYPHQPMPKKEIEAIDLIRQIDTIWEQHVFWTREFIIREVNNIDDTIYVARLLRNSDDMAQIFGEFYPQHVAHTIRDIFHDHLTIAAELVGAAKANQMTHFNEIDKRWYQNADQIVSYLSEINPYYDYNELKKMFYSHLDLTKKEVVAQLEKKPQQDVETFDQIEKEALMMAKMFSSGLIRQFSERR